MLRGYRYREEFNRPELKRYVQWRDNQKPDEDGFTYTIETYETSLRILDEKYKKEHRYEQ